MGSGITRRGAKCETLETGARFVYLRNSEVASVRGRMRGTCEMRSQPGRAVSSGALSLADREEGKLSWFDGKLW